MHNLLIYFPSVHVQSVDLELVDDVRIWDFALREGLAIVTKDEDYSLLSVFPGTPPKIIWMQLGNCTTAKIESTLRLRFQDLVAFENDALVGVLILS